MKCNLVILAVLATLVSTAPAAADSIHLSVSPTSTYLDGPAVTYQISGETEVGRGYAIRLMHVGWEGSNCGHAAKTESHNVREASVGPSPKFEYSGNLSAATEFYEALGTYVVCAVTVNSEAPAETSASFTVVTPLPPPQSPGRRSRTPPATRLSHPARLLVRALHRSRPPSPRSPPRRGPTAAGCAPPWFVVRSGIAAPPPTSMGRTPDTGRC
jgi:hypothetical protein